MLISLKRNTLYLLAMVATLKPSAMGRDFYQIKNSFSFVENRIYWSTVTLGG
jgi:hypothetical protein